MEINFYTQALSSLVVGLACVVCLNIYSKIIEKLHNDYIRIIVFLIFCSVIFLIPEYCISYLINLGQNALNEKQRTALLAAWLSPILIFIVCRWKILMRRLGGNKKPC
jgi:hypothetical protein